MAIPPEDDAVRARLMISALGIGPDLSPGGIDGLPAHDIPESLEC
jgi:hypothetical protein